MSGANKGMEKIEEYLEKIEILFKKNAYIRYITLSLLSLFLLFFIEKNIFSILSLPWAISYLITSSWNGQFDQNIFREIFNVDNGIDKIRLLNLAILGAFYGFFLTLINFVFNIFTQKGILHKKKKISIMVLTNVFFIFSIFCVSPHSVESIVMFLISLGFFGLINFYFLKNNLNLVSDFFYDDIKETTKNGKTGKYILCAILFVSLVSIIVYLLFRDNSLMRYYTYINQAYDLLIVFKYRIIALLVSVYLIILFLSFRRLRKDKKNIFSRNVFYGLLIVSITLLILIIINSRVFDFDEKILFIYLVPFILLILYKITIYMVSKNIGVDFSNSIHLENKKAGEIIGSFGHFIFSSLFGNEILFLLYFIGVIIFISTKDINNQSVFQGVLPVEGYISINKYDENLEKIHNKLQLPSNGYNSKSNITLIDKVKIINGDTQEGRILGDFCILWESDKYYYISTYFIADNVYRPFDCKTLNNIQLLKIEKSSDLDIRYLKDIHFDNLNYSIYKSLITEDYPVRDIEREVYNMISKKYSKKTGYNNYNSADTFADIRYEKNTTYYLDTLFDYIITKITKKEEIDYDYILSESLIRSAIINKFVNGIKNDNIYKYFIAPVKLDQKIDDFIGRINKDEEKTFYDTLKSIFENNKTITGEKVKDKIAYIEDNIIFNNIKNNLKYIGILGSMPGNADISSKLISNYENKKENFIKNGCIEILTKNNIVYNVSDLTIQYTLTEKENGNYTYTYIFTPATQGFTLNYGICRE
ncbi:MAG: hypothetical protein PHH16_04035 [Candidatus Gracilibacteria bacterium]|nr:hypothetical protein [Candidatus Gracilibacteria bacterium]